MTEIIEITLPKLGESIVGATVVQWLKNVGDEVRVDEALLEVSTDKVNSEIPSPVAGVIKEILVEPDQEIEIGAPLLKIEVGEAPAVSPQVEVTRVQAEPKCAGTGKEEVFSPAVLRLAQLEGISIDTLRTIHGTGEGGRITKKDVEKFIAGQVEPPTPTVAEGGEERIRLSGMRKAIADNMVRSFYEAPHASLVAEADVTDVMRLVAREKERFLQTHGVKLTITSFLIQALTKALQQFPMLNSSLEEETIVMKRFINVGVAVNVDKGLMVPVIKNCHERNLVSVARAVADLSARARTGKLSPDEVAEGTVTLTNFGMTGALIGVPIIRYPEVAIMGAGTIQKRVVVREDDSFAVRQMMYLTLTFDHRIIDGIYGCQFLAAFKNHLESVSLH
ncbi:MAG: Dihydrolipoyllysine-residue acetyltransferase component of pyruvate dehydrogenase complex [Chlamydiales bacterium]|nr:Dihydrolipoyllysine-residue acetyltransferase component of pyruvate dehydrogenase complex [Chlamydiales bacterium]